MSSSRYLVSERRLMSDSFALQSPRGIAARTDFISANAHARSSKFDYAVSGTTFSRRVVQGPHVDPGGQFLGSGILPGNASRYRAQLRAEFRVSISTKSHESRATIRILVAPMKVEMHIVLTYIRQTDRQKHTHIQRVDKKFKSTQNRKI